MLCWRLPALGNIEHYHEEKQHLAYSTLLFDQFWAEAMALTPFILSNVPLPNYEMSSFMAQMRRYRWRWGIFGRFCQSSNLESHH